MIYILHIFIFKSDVYGMLQAILCMRATFVAFRVGYTRKLINYGPRVWPLACNEFTAVVQVSGLINMYQRTVSSSLIDNL